MAEATGAEQDVMRLSGDDLYDHFETTLWHTERTIYNTLGVAKYLMSRHVRHVNYKVVLTGEGSDELFAGYPAFRRDMFLHGSDDEAGEQDQRQKRLDQANALVTGGDAGLSPWKIPISLRRWASPPAACSHGWPVRRWFQGYWPPSAVRRWLATNQAKRLPPP